MLYNLVTMQEFLDQLESQLVKIGGYSFVRSLDSITVQSNSQDGFSVTVYGDSMNSFVVNYGHYWHGHYDSEEQAADWFMAGVTGWARLVCTYRWRYLLKAAVELKVEDGWILADTSGSCLGLFVWWLPKHIKIYGNKPVQRQ